MKTCIYLRKSRQDEELEKKESTDTLARHRSTLLGIARDQKLDIIEIKEEVVSGGNIKDRPKMLQLLEEVKNNMYDAVLCMDLDRLGRGGMQDQGLILDTFKESRTLIVTPDKTYNLNNEYDEEMTEFKSFFARRELKMITRRMQRGREKSVEEGKFIASYSPFGYKFEYNEHGARQLIIDEEKAAVVRNIFDMYVNGNGAYKIKVYLDSIGARTNNGIRFSEQAIRRILKNKTYCGYVTWNKYSRKGTITKKRNEDEIIISKGKHESIVSEELWLKADSIRANNQIVPTGNNKQRTNPLAGLIKCKCCNKTMTCSYSNYQGQKVKYLRCKQCQDNRGAKLYELEDAILEHLQFFLKEVENNILENVIENKDTERMDNLKQTLILLEKESKELDKQKNNLHDLLERGIYDVDTYLDRTTLLSRKSEENKNAIDNIIKLIEQEETVSISYNDLVPNIETVIIQYRKTEDVELKNYLLKSIIDEIIYYKQKGKKTAKFEIDLKLKLNKS